MPRDIRRTLRSLPKTLDETYARILQSIDNVYHQQAITALQWLAFSERPLRITELAEAIIIDPRADEPYCPEDRLPNPYDVLKILSTLATTSKSIYRGADPLLQETEVEEVRLAHYSVKEYLVSNRAKPPQVESFCTTDVIAHSALAESCLLYIKSITALERPLLSNIDYHSSYFLIRNYGKDDDRFPLLQYACNFWHKHVEAIEDDADKSLLESASQILHSPADLYIWLSGLALIRFSMGEYELGSKPHGRPLYFACLLQLSRLVELLLQEGADVNERSGSEGCALLVACVRWHGGIVKLLLNANADVNAQGGHYNTALQAACYRGNEAVVQLLLNNGADVNAQGGGFYNTALEACSRRNKAVVQLLLEFGATRPEGVCPEEFRYLLEEDSDPDKGQDDQESEDEYDVEA